MEIDLLNFQVCSTKLCECR